MSATCASCSCGPVQPVTRSREDSTSHSPMARRTSSQSPRLAANSLRTRSSQRDGRPGVARESPSAMSRSARCHSPSRYARSTAIAVIVAPYVYSRCALASRSRPWRTVSNASRRRPAACSASERLERSTASSSSRPARAAASHALLSSSIAGSTSPSSSRAVPSVPRARASSSGASTRRAIATDSSASRRASSIPGPMSNADARRETTQARSALSGSAGTSRTASRR